MNEGVGILIKEIASAMMNNLSREEEAKMFTKTLNVNKLKCQGLQRISKMPNTPYL